MDTGGTVGHASVAKSETASVAAAPVAHMENVADLIRARFHDA
jgi:hypothetical protein